MKTPLVQQLSMASIYLACPSAAYYSPVLVILEEAGRGGRGGVGKVGKRGFYSSVIG